MRSLKVSAVVVTLVACCASVLVTASAASAATSKFSDVPPKSQFYGDITWLAANDITTGNANGTFGPAQLISRQAMAAFLYRFANPGTAAAACTTKPFTDVSTDSPFCADIAWLKENGVTTGNSDGTYGTLDAVSRAAMAAFMYRVVNRTSDGSTPQPPACTAKPFNDVSMTNPFCGDIKWLVGRGVADGYSDGGYHPNASVAREAMAAFLHRLNDGGSGLTAPPPATSNAHYIRTADAGVLTAAGASDAAADQAAGGAHVHLLDIGAQSISPPLTAEQPGVALSVTSTHLTYPALVTLLESYLHSYQDAGGNAATVAVGTNSDGCWGTCPPTKTGIDVNQTSSDKGAQWWTDVVEPLRNYAPGLTIVGADDIEIGFHKPDQGASQAQVAQWESSYSSKATAAGVSGLQLVFNGSADGCPSSYGKTAGTCNDGWTEAKLAALASGPHTQALPQIYNSAQAVQWANIDSTVNGTITFLGTLTEYAADAPMSQLPNRGWIGLWNALTAGQQAPLLAAKLPNSVDLDVLS